MIRLALMILLLLDTAVIALLGAGLLTGRGTRTTAVSAKRAESRSIVPLPEEAPAVKGSLETAPQEEETVRTPQSLPNDEPIKPVKSQSEVDRILEEFNKAKILKAAGKNGKTSPPQEVKPLQAVPGQVKNQTKPVKTSPVKGKLHNIAFTYRNSRAKAVWLVGDFNRWEAGKDPFVKGKDGVLWTCVKRLPDGRFLYGYSVDGRVILDPNNPRHEGRRSLLVLPKPVKAPTP